MKRNLSIRTIIILCLPLFIFSCKTKKKISESNGEEVLSEVEVLSAIESANLDYEYLEFSGSADISSPDLSITGSFLMRLQKGKKAWIQVKKFGFEGARVLIADDSIKILNRLEKSCQVMSLDEASRLINFKLNLDQCIELLAGNAFFENSELVSMDNDSSLYTYKVAFDDFFSEYVFDPFEEKVVSTHMLDMDNRSMQVDYSDFNVLEDGQKSSFYRSYAASSDKIGDAGIDITVRKISLPSELSFPFEIPSHYEIIR